MSVMEAVGILRLDGLAEIQRMYHHTDIAGNLYLPQVSFMRSLIDEQDMYLIPTCTGDKSGKLIFKQVLIEESVDA
jgi:hypothetical protein